MPVDTNYEVKLTGTFQGDVWQNVLHYQCTVATGSDGRTADVGGLLELISTTFVDVLKAAQTGTAEILSARVQEVGIVEPIIEKRGLVVAGTATGDPFPASDAVLFVKRANTGGRANVGKFYLVGAPDDKAVGGIVDTGWDPFEALAVQLKTNLVGDGRTFAPVIWHRTAQTATFITKVDVRAQMSRQNRRTLPVL